MNPSGGDGVPWPRRADDDALRWRPTSAHTAAVVAGVVLLGMGIAAGRADVALLGVPALAAAVWARGTPPGRLVQARLDEPEGPTHAGELRATLRLDAPEGAGLAHLRVTAPGHRETQVVVRAADAGGSRPGDTSAVGRSLDLSLASVRTGPQETFTVGLRAYGPAGVWEQTPSDAAGHRRLVLPGAQPLGRLPLPGRLRGLTGPHTSRRLGDGSELRDVHPFAPGDRLRRIDWRATARRSPDLDPLYVRRTYATAEATAVLVVDSRDDVGPDVRTWRGYGTQRVDEPTSLDLARHAAASVATAFVDTGDRVGLEDLARRRRPLPPASGRRHLRRVLHALALAHPVDQATVHRVRPPQVPADAIVYLFSTMLDDEPVRLVRTWRELGHEVVLVDTLPDVHAVAETHLRIGWRIARMERDLRIEALASEGVPVVSWAGSQRPRAAVRLEAVARQATRRPR
ncbi:DUF58 domain-containing protein [Antribacter sp. KLBMP9083]|uniref:DUF58 domain-containing protein n=1 Tax=Antribacter soli TaxID=2910976 RepID=A0AA41QCD7_9MICO|nr:DUF58 domain-containing protein [Antribacter soli]MCF4120844.1 DUF58 domain-containing protein [Antribacter soli]